MDSQLLSVRQPKLPAASAAVVFVHGFGGDTKETWQDFPKLLAEEPKLAGWDIFTLGYDTRLRVDILKLWSADPDLNEVALKLRTDAKTGALKDHQSLCLIAHSMGGLAVQRAPLDIADFELAAGDGETLLRPQAVRSHQRYWHVEINTA